MVLNKEKTAYILLCLNIAISAMAIYTAHFIKSSDLLVRLDLYLSIIIPAYLAIVFFSIIFTDWRQNASLEKSVFSWYDAGIVLSLIIAMIYFATWYLSS